jgi:protein O-mannosyl-transferase
MFEKAFRKSLLVWAVIAMVTIALYSTTVSFGILNNYDDDAYISDTRISQLTSGHVADYFSGYYLGMYQPLPVLSFATMLHFFPGSIEGQRILNILLHCLNIFLVLILVRKLSGSHFIGALTALVFAVHPMNVESVTWLSARSNLMYAFFFLSAMILYLRWQRHPRWWSWGAMFLVFILALFCKVTAATFPLVVILLDWFTGRKFNRSTLLFYLPLILVSLVFIRTGIRSSEAFGHITELGTQYTLTERFLILLHALWLYLYKAVVPLFQSVIYLFPWKSGNMLPQIYPVTGVAVLAILGGLLFTGWKFRKQETGRIILFGLLFFLVTISIVMPLKWSRTIIIAERYTYIPYIGLVTAVLWLVFRYIQNSRVWVKRLILGFLCIWILFIGVKTHQRIRVWKNPVTLFTDVIQKDRSGAEVSMGFYNRGNEYLRLQALDKAFEDYTAAVRIQPGYSDAWYNLGIVSYRMGRNAEALADFSETIRLEKDFMPAYLNRGTVYRALGDYSHALDDFTQAITLDPNGPAYFSRGVLYQLNLGETQQACTDWVKALQMGYEPARELLETYCR